MNPPLEGRVNSSNSSEEVSPSVPNLPLEEEVALTPAPLTQETKEFFNDDILRCRVFLDKYALRDRSGRVVEKTPVEMWQRVARELASGEENEALRNEWQEKFYWLLSDFRFIPGGRILFGAGNPRNVTLLNCYVIPVKEDRLEAIFDWMKEAARTYSYGGGVGTDISILRPKGARVNNAALTSTGSVSFMDLFSLTTGTIGQSGRRGALMITTRDSHPDILDFVRVKRDLRTVRFANISVRVSDALMKAVEKDEDFELYFENEKVRVTRKVRAREVWKELVKGARDWAEPGVLFWDSIKKESTSEYNGMEVISTNPCVTGDTRIHTEHGLVQVKELYAEAKPLTVTIDKRTDGKSDLYGAATTTSTPIFKTSDKAKVYKLETDAGYEIKATDWHEFYVAKPYHVSYEDGKKRNITKFNIEKKKLKEIKEGEILLIQSGEGQFGQTGYYELGLVSGLIAGDGTFGDKKALIELWNENQEVIEEVHRAAESVISADYARLDRDPEWISRNSSLAIQEMPELKKIRIGSVRLARIFKELYSFSKESKLKVPELVWQGTKDCVRGYLQGLFSADGSVWTRKRKKDEIALSLTSINLSFLKEIQVLLSNFGIFCRIYQEKRNMPSKFFYTTRAGEKREYTSSQCYSLRLHGENVVYFMQKIGFLQKEKSEKFQQWFKERKFSFSRKKEKFLAKVSSITYAGEEAVYDATQFYNHSLIFNGIVTGNCGEIPLEGYGDCCLGNINLSKFVEEEFTENSRVNWTALEKAARYGVRFLDNVLDYNADKHPLKAQTEASVSSRRIGLGFTGLGDMLCQMRLKYDTDQAISFVDHLFERIKNFAYDESVNIGLEKGVFKLYDSEQHLKSPFIQRLDSNVLKRVEAHGLRNVAVLTVPPVGSGAALAGTTSGVEPIFDLSYVRRSESLSQEFFKVYHPLVDRYMKRFNLKDDSQLPEFFVTAHHIAPEKRVYMQATIQKHIDHSISSTVNIHRDSTEEDVEKIYFLAWKMGCKGITVYREGSREGVLITDEEVKRKEKENLAKAGGAGSAHPLPSRKRPKVTEGRTERIETPRGPIYVTINEDELGLCEVFVKSLDAEAEVTGRLASLLLRAAIDPREVIEQMWRVRTREVAFDRSVDDTVVCVTTVAQGIALALGRYLYGDSFNPQKAYPRASTLPEPIKFVKQLKLDFAKTSLADKAQAAPEIKNPAPMVQDPPKREYGPTRDFVGVCPDCGVNLIFENGCAVCKDCGYSRCG